MNLDELWQENKRFLSFAGLGVLLFAVGLAGIDSAFGGELREQLSTKGSLETKLRGALFTRADQDVARDENDALRAALERLRGAAEHEPREGFRLAPDGGSAALQYQRIAARVREELLPLAARGDLALDETLGLPSLSPTEEFRIERHLAALDVVDQAVRLALDAGVARVERIQTKLDPALVSRDGPGAVETTRVELRLGGSSLALARLLASTQDPAHERRLVVHSFEMIPARTDASGVHEVRLDLVLLVVRVQPDTSGEEAGA